MKQSLSRARLNRRLLLIVIVIAVIPLGSCARQSQRVTPTTESSDTVNEKLTSSRLNINTSSAAELEKLPGLGKILAERIVTHRERYGPFRRVEHLMMVPGFSDHKFRALRDFVTVG